MDPINNSIDVVFSFDTTGSMYPCLGQVRKRVRESVTRLTKDVPGIRIGIIAHGDYCDKNSTYVTKALQLTANCDDICRFVDNVGATGGGDSPECYELVLHEARDLNWKGDKRILVMMGDDIPHSPAQNPQHLDWRKEAQELKSLGVSTHAVQCLNRRYATQFYTELATIGGGYRVPLDQFSDITEILLALCYQQSSPEAAVTYIESVEMIRSINRNLSAAFNIITGKAPKTVHADSRLVPVEIGRFQILDVDKDCAIKQFVLDNGLKFKIGRGFYQFTKREEIQDYKQIVLRDKLSGDMFTGGEAREMLDLPPTGKVTIRPKSFEKFDVFVQSTSYNRKLINGTKFLYEVDED
jgi:hypothetical protein